MSEKKASSIKSAQNHFLNMKGHIKNGNENVSKAIIEVIYSDSKIRHCMVKSGTTGLCEFKLPLQSHFLIEFSKDGYITKKITVDTHVPTKKIGNFFCEFESELFPQIPEVNAEHLLKEPITNFFFKTKGSNFAYNKAVTDSLNSHIRNMYTEYYASKANKSNLTSTKSTRRIPEVLK